MDAEGKNALALLVDDADESLRDLLVHALERELPRCGFCGGSPAHIQFFPCGHRNACSRCCEHWKNCGCGAEIAEKVDVLTAPKRAKRPSEDIVQTNQRLMTENSRLKRANSELSAENSGLKRDNSEWKRENSELNAEKTCPVCLLQPKALIFTPCGHASCEDCGARIDICHSCRKIIRHRVKMY